LLNQGTKIADLSTKSKFIKSKSVGQIFNFIKNHLNVSFVMTALAVKYVLFHFLINSKTSVCENNCH